MEKVGEYTIIKKLGEGGFGVVYLAHLPERPGLGKVAIKLFRVHSANMAEMEASEMATEDAVSSLRARFMREAELLRSLADYPHIVNVYEPPKLLEDGSAYYVMPYLERSLADEIGSDRAGLGTTIIQNLKQRPKKLSIARALTILRELAMALSVVHQKGLVHRDIKPPNIMFNSLGQVTLVDFGIAKASNEHTALTQSNMGMGSRHYMAPEQFTNAKKVDARADVYAFGVLAFRLFTGKLPELFANEPSHYRKELKGPIEKFILRCTSRNASARPANGSALLKELNALEKHLASPGKIAVGFYSLLVMAAAGGVVIMLSGGDRKVISGIAADVTEAAERATQLGQEKLAGIFTSAKLTVATDPEYARVRILNIQKPYSPGMELERGESYHIEVWAAGFRAHSEWIQLDKAKQTVSIQLRRNSS